MSVSLAFLSLVLPKLYADERLSFLATLRTLGVYAVPIRPPSAPAWEDAPVWRTGDIVQVLTRRENPS